MKTNKKKGFTLVELLAVIVILAIILVIAVPKVMTVIEDSKKATLESTAKMIASAAEKAKVQNTVLGKDEGITCDSVAKINKLDYESCSIEFVDNTAKVTIAGKGKFAGLYVCDGTKTGANASKESCAGNCLISDVETIYNINIDNCVTHLKDFYIEYDQEEYTDEDIRALCADDNLDSDTYVFNYIDGFIDEKYITEEELIQKEVYKIETKNICITEETPGSCFTYVQPYQYKVNDVESCTNYIKDTLEDYYGFDASQTNAICSGDEEEFDSTIHELIVEEYHTEQELIDNNVIKIIYDDYAIITGYNENCGVDNVIVPNTIDGIKVTEIWPTAFAGTKEVCEENCDPECWEECSDDDGGDCEEVCDEPDTCSEDCWDAPYNLSIKRIRFSKNVNYIRGEFYTSGLKYVYVENPNAEIGNCAFGDINNIENHNLPDTYQCYIEEDDEYYDDDLEDECEHEVCEEMCDEEECWEECGCE